MSTSFVMRTNPDFSSNYLVCFDNIYFKQLLCNPFVRYDKESMFCHHYFLKHSNYLNFISILIKLIQSFSLCGLSIYDLVYLLNAGTLIQNIIQFCLKLNTDQQIDHISTSFVMRSNPYFSSYFLIKLIQFLCIKHI